MKPKEIARRVAAVAFAALLTTSSLPAAALEGVRAADPRVALADGDGESVRGTLEDQSVYKFEAEGEVFPLPVMYPYGTEKSVPATLSHGGNTYSYPSNHVSLASKLADMGSITASLDASSLSAYLAVNSSATLPTSASDYFFAGWYLYNNNARSFALLTKNEELTPSDVSAYFIAHPGTSPSMDFSAIYLPKEIAGTLRYYPASRDGTQSGTPITQSYDVVERTLKLTGADTGDVEATQLGYYHVTSWDWHNINVTTGTPDYSVWDDRKVAGATDVLSKSQIEAFLQSFQPGELIILDMWNGAYIAPTREANTLSVTFHSGTGASAVSKAYSIVHNEASSGSDGTGAPGASTAEGTVAVAEGAPLDGAGLPTSEPIPTLALLQASSDSATAAAFATPANMKFDGWYASATELTAGSAVPASAAVAGANAVVDTTTELDETLRTKASTTLHLYPMWISDALGWVKDPSNNILYYEDVNGTKTAATGQRIIGNQVFLFNNNGYLQTGWVGTGADRRYYVPDKGQAPYNSGAMATDGLRTIGTDTYYFKANGSLATNEPITVGGKTYYFGADGTRQVGLIGTGVAARYYDPEADGAMVTNRLVIIGTDRYYFRGNGTMAVDEAVTVPGATYYFGADGKVVTGWVGTGASARYYDPAHSGAMATGGKTSIGADEWFFYQDGSHAIGKIEASGDHLYYFGADGMMVRSQKVTVNSVEYTADAQGVLTWNFKAQKSGFTLGRDNNGFIHSNSSSWGSRAGFLGHSNYRISDELYRKLVSGANWGDRWSVEWLMNRTWGGSCYGIAVSMGLLFEGKLTTADFTSNGQASNYYTLPLPYTEDKTIDTINYFMLSQMLTQFDRYHYSSSYTASGLKNLSNYHGTIDSLDVFLRDLVTNPGGESVRLLCYFVHGWGHAILVTGVDFDPMQNKYTVQLYDMNSVGRTGNGSFRTMTVGTDFKSFEFRDGNNTLINTNNFQSLCVGSIAGFDAINPRKITAYGLRAAAAEEPRALDFAADDASAGHAFLAVSLDNDFTLANAAGQKLVNRDSELSGDLPVYSMSPLPMDDESLCLLEVDAGTITVQESEGTLDLMMRDADHFLAFEGDHVSSAQLDLASERIDVQGDRVEFIAHVATEKSDDGLLAVSGIASSGMTVAKAGKSVNVSAKGEGAINNVEVAVYNGAEVAKRTFSTAATGFHVSAGQDVSSLPEDLNETGLSDGTDQGGSVGNGWQTVDGKRYYSEAGRSVTGWKKLDGSWYYFSPTDRGALQTGWVYDGGWYFCDYASGIMQLGWVADGGQWYWLAPATGLMAQGQWVSDGAWYWMRQDGSMATGWIAYAGGWYYAAGNGKMATGWVLDGGTWYWMDASGKMTTGWTVCDGVWYHFDETGALSVDTWVGNDHVDSQGRWDATR